MDRSRRGPPAANPPGAPSSDEEVHSNDEIFRKIKDYVMEAEREDEFRLAIPFICACIGHLVVGGSEFVRGC